MKGKISLLLAVFIFSFITTCGIYDDDNYLPPVLLVDSQLGAGAEITLPSIDIAYYYVQKFTIFYRIYLSNYTLDFIPPEVMGEVNTQLLNDYNHFNNTLIAPVNASPPSRNSFESRNYYELREEVLPYSSAILNTHGGASQKIIKINFNPGEYVYISDELISLDHNILRNTGFILIPDEYFYYSEDLLAYDDNTGPGKANNRDVIGTAGMTYSSAYISMYIVTEGRNVKFQPVFSRPKHIGVFRLLP